MSFQEWASSPRSEPHNQLELFMSSHPGNHHNPQLDCDNLQSSNIPSSPPSQYFRPSIVIHHREPAERPRPPRPHPSLAKRIT